MTILKVTVKKALTWRIRCVDNSPMTLLGHCYWTTAAHCRGIIEDFMFILGIYFGVMIIMASLLILGE